MSVRPARAVDDLTIRRLLDAAVLEVDDVEGYLEAGTVLVAVSDSDSERILGTLVYEPLDAPPTNSGAHIVAIAVRKRRQGQGIGTQLVETALDRYGRLTATFDEPVRPFYDTLGFSIEPLDDGRYAGVLDTVHPRP